MPPQRVCNTGIVSCAPVFIYLSISNNQSMTIAARPSPSLPQQPRPSVPDAFGASSPSSPNNELCHYHRSSVIAGEVPPYPSVQPPMPFNPTSLDFYCYAYVDCPPCRIEEERVEFYYYHIAEVPAADLFYNRLLCTNVYANIALYTTIRTHTHTHW